MTDISGRPILVAGATGRQGGSVVRHLLQRRLAVRALVQNPHSDRAKALADQGIEIAQGDMDDLTSLRKAMAGVHGVYSVQDYFTVGAAREVQEGKNMADAARDAGVEHFVFSSVGGAERNSGIHHFETKWEIENHIRKLGLPATMIRPAGFMENYYIPQLEKQLLKGRLLDPVRAGKPLQTIASDDIGKFISLAFAQPDRFIGLGLEIAGSELTRPDTAEVFSRVLGRRVKAYHLPMTLVRLSMGKEWYQMFAWLNKSGFQADILALRRDDPDVPLTSLEEWLRRVGWTGRREITVKRDSMGRPVSAALPISVGGVGDCDKHPSRVGDRAVQEPTEGIWSLLKRSIANFAAADQAGLVRIIKRKLKKIQYRPRGASVPSSRAAATPDVAARRGQGADAQVRPYPR